MARKGDTPEYVRKMQEELFGVLSKAKSRRELREVEGLAQEVRKKYLQGINCADIRDLAIRRRLSRTHYSRRCAEASAVKAYQKRGISLAPGMEIGYVVRDAAKWEVDAEGDASKFDAVYYGKLLEKAWEEVAFALNNANYW